LIIDKEISMKQQDTLVRGAAITVRAALIANRLFLGAVAAGFVATWVATGFFDRILLQADPVNDVAAALTGVRLLLLIGGVMAVATDRLLSALGAVVASAAQHDPFVPANAGRLMTIGWSLLVLQLLDLLCAGLAHYWTSLGTAAPRGDISLGGWVATLMVFVLARAFAAGAVMREDLEGTI
jgi:hypothetical protein